MNDGTTPKDNIISQVLSQYGFDRNNFSESPIGSGYIHLTYKLSGSDRNLILQRVNKNVFQNPEIIASNIKLASVHLKKHFPGYLFLTALETTTGDQMAYDPDGFPWRIFPYFENTRTIDKVDNVDQAFNAAAEFARLVKYLEKVDVNSFKPVIAGFHDLALRYKQFENACLKASPERLLRADDLIIKARSYQYLVSQYASLIGNKKIPLRITHNDTKINNILFHTSNSQAVCAIDLDTLMPGYTMYDIGDMIRTFVSPVDEEEQDLNKVAVRGEIYEAIVGGYLSQMSDLLTHEERMSIPFSGLMMTYIMALRMLTDFLNGDIYYRITYKDQNLIRSRNQFHLLDLLKEYSQK
jgi:thiamine kinase-like enzyme